MGSAEGVSGLPHLSSGQHDLQIKGAAPCFLWCHNLCGTVEDPITGPLLLRGKDPVFSSYGGL